MTECLPPDDSQSTDNQGTMVPLRWRGPQLILAGRDNAGATAQQMFEQLMEDTTPSYLPVLGRSLRSHAHALGGSDMQDAALKLAEVAVMIARTASMESLQRRRGDLFNALNTLAGIFQALGRVSEAATASEEATRVHDATDLFPFLTPNDVVGERARSQSPGEEKDGVTTRRNMLGLLGPSATDPVGHARAATATVDDLEQLAEH